MSDIVSKLRKLGDDNSIDMSGRHTIAECLNAFGGNDRREISKAVKGAFKPLDVSLLKVGVQGTDYIGSSARADLKINATYITIYGTVPDGASVSHSFKNACKVSLDGGEYEFTSDFPGNDANNCFKICDSSNNAVLAYANTHATGRFGLFGSRDVYLRLDVAGPFDFDGKRYSFKLIQTQ